MWAYAVLDQRRLTLHGVLVQENDLLFYKLLDFVRIRIVDDFEALLLLS